MSEGSIKDRLSSLSRAELVGVVLLVLVLLAGAGLWYARSLPRTVEVRAESADSGQATAPDGAASPSPAVLLVDVAGWVRQPGVYEFHEGDRIIDAIEAAGGARHGAALDSLNLAAPLADGTQVLVARQMAGGTPGTVGATASSSGGTTSPTVNINTATAMELEALPGVGEVIAQRIVDYRTENGPFASVDELLDVSGIGDATLAEMRDMVTV